jgi:hypothetical protein
METQLQDVLTLWENAATEARGESSKETADLCKQARADSRQSATAALRSCTPSPMRSLRAAARCAPQVEALQEKLAGVEEAARAQEATLRAEIDKIMQLWDEAQRTSAQEVQELQDRVMELKGTLAEEREAVQRLEARQEDYDGF